VTDREYFTKVPFAVAPVVSSKQDAFSSWLGAGTGAAVTLMIPNLKDLVAIIGSHHLFAALALCAVSLAACARQKWLSIKVMSADSMVTKLGFAPQTPTAEQRAIVADELSRISVFPFSWLMRRAALKGEEIGPLMMKHAQRQTLMVWAQTFCVFAGMALIAYGIVSNGS
jgi:hypothetical protein